MITEKLLKKGFTIGLCGEIVGYLKSMDLINDQRFAEEWTRSRLKNNPCGIRALKAGLEAKGIPKSVIEKVLTAGYPDINDEKIAEVLVGKKFGVKISRISLLDAGSKAKVYRYLLQKGIDEEVIGKITGETIEYE